MTKDELLALIVKARDDIRRAESDSDGAAHNLTTASVMAGQTVELLDYAGGDIDEAAWGQLRRHIELAKDGAGRAIILAQGARSDCAAALAVAVDATDRVARAARDKKNGQRKE